MSAIPQTMRAVVQHPEASAPNSIPFFASEGRSNMGALVKEVPVPQLGENDVLVKVAYAAQNPTDWKHSYYMSPPNAIIGCDFSGTVVKLGGGTVNSNIQVGDRVAGTVHGGLFPDKGSYAEYLKVQSDLVFKVPERLTLEEASTFGIPWITAAQNMVYSQGRPFPPAQVKDEWFLVYAGSTSVGLYAIQLAKAMGYKVITTASPHSFDLVRQYGADEVVSYRDGPAASACIVDITGGGVSIGLDCIAEEGSFDICLDAFRGGEGMLNVLLPAPPAIAAKRTDVRKAFTLVYSLLGHDWNITPLGEERILPAPKEDRAFGVELFARSAELIERYQLKPLPVKLQGGLDDITTGWEEQAAGKVSGVKLVYKIDQ